MIRDSAPLRSGTIPVAVGCFQILYEFSAHDNELSGSIPDALMSEDSFIDLVINDNHLTGSMSFLGSQVLILVRSQIWGRGCDEPCEP